MYNFIKEVQMLYRLLEDDLSKNVFWARLACDLEPSMTNVMRLQRKDFHVSGEEINEKNTWKNTFQSLNQAGKKIILYGTGLTGKKGAENLQYEQVDFYGFCGRRAAEFKNGLMGKPVVAPEYLTQHAEECYVVIMASHSSANEILELLRERDFPEEHILHYFDMPSNTMLYFEFPSLYRRGTTFIDGGCFDCKDDYIFSEWCEGQYSNIIAFEPDPTNFDKCLRNLECKPIANLQLIPAGLSDQVGTIEFGANGSEGSHIIKKATNSYIGSVRQKIRINTVTIDDVADNQTVGFIKMDIEGAEMDALRGARQTILRDKPLLAISVYHRQGDLLAIMEALHQYVPEYRFWLRHYGPFSDDTVLYASVDALKAE